MIKIETDKLEFSQGLDNSLIMSIYNGLDALITYEVFNVLDSLRDETSTRMYDFSRSMQGPALAMMLRGVRIDKGERDLVVMRLRKQQDRLRTILDALSDAIGASSLFGKSDISRTKLHAALHDCMGLPEVQMSFKGVRRASLNREALEKLAESYPRARPIINAVLRYRDNSKKIATLLSAIDADGRMRCSYNVAATETGRWSSSANAFGRGTNLQNISNDERRIFIADPGMKFCQVDLAQAESWIVAHESQDEAYIEACRSGDPHTFCARLLWPDLPWTGNLAEDQKVAERPFYRHFSYRDMAKRGGHLKNYRGTAYTMAQRLKISQKVAEDFEQLYYTTFSRIPAWHREIAQEIAIMPELTTCLGFRRQFFGRRFDDATIREAIAFKPQSTIGQLLNSILYELWQREKELSIELLLQVHDSITFQFPEAREMEIVPKVLEIFKRPLEIRGRRFIVPATAEVGYCWAKASKHETDPELPLLQKWYPDGRTLRQKRTERKAPALLDIVL